jgi:uncharacterized Zn-finger protein
VNGHLNAASVARTIKTTAIIKHIYAYTRANVCTNANTAIKSTTTPAITKSIHDCILVGTYFVLDDFNFLCKYIIILIKLKLKLITIKTKGEKPYMCTVCGRQFHRSDYLKLHSYSHTSERPFNCDICGKGFKMNYNLKMHLKCHENNEITTESIESQENQETDLTQLIISSPNSGEHTNAHADCADLETYSIVGREEQKLYI